MSEDDRYEVLESMERSEMYYEELKAQFQRANDIIRRLVETFGAAPSIYVMNDFLKKRRLAREDARHYLQEIDGDTH